MCGRARCTLRPEQVARACCVGGPDGGPCDTVDVDKYRPSYNLSPGAYLPVVAFRREKAEDAGGEEGKEVGKRAVLHCMKWGLVPSFTKKDEKPDHYRMFNARSESVTEKASFRRLMQSNRCLVAAEGFYEWKKDGSRKQPYYIHFKDGRPLVFAALCDCWKNREGENLYTFTILTTTSSSALQWLHDRMPVILGDKSSIDLWINSPASKCGSVMGPYEGSDLGWYPVTPAMGKSAFDGAECIKEIKLEPPESRPISKFFSKKIVNKRQPDLDVQRIHVPETTKQEPGVDGIIEEQNTKKVGIKEEPDSVVERKSSYTPEQEYYRDEKETERCSAKRGYQKEVPSSIPRSAVDSKKKGKTIKQAGDAQATLLSYFSKS